MKYSLKSTNVGESKSSFGPPLQDIKWARCEIQNAFVWRQTTDICHCAWTNVQHDFEKVFLLLFAKIFGTDKLYSVKKNFKKNLFRKFFCFQMDFTHFQVKKVIWLCIYRTWNYFVCAETIKYLFTQLKNSFENNYLN